MVTMLDLSWIYLLVCAVSLTYALPNGGHLARKTFSRQPDPSPYRASSSRDDDSVLEIRMPGVAPREDDAYYCMSRAVPVKELYITNFEALAEGSVAHHILLFGCQNPYSHQTDAWECTSACDPHDSSSILFAWAKNAPPTHVPEGVGFEIGDNTNVQYLVMQIHYKDRFPLSADPDHSGLRLTVTLERQKYMAGIYLFSDSYHEIPGGAQAVHVDMACPYPGPAQLYPFAFRVHAHTLGKVISGYMQNDSSTWHLIGKGNPQWPQAFYPSESNLVIKKGDILAARCTFDSSARKRKTFMGSTHLDEMCNFYMMYYTDATQGKSYFGCQNNQSDELTETLPADSDQPLPPNPLLEDIAHGHQRKVDLAKGWPNAVLTIGQIGGMATDSKGQIHIFHRADRVWGHETFDHSNVFQGNEAISKNTILVLDVNGNIVKQWGANRFYLPHGLSIDTNDNLWLTDVALHQVMRISNGATEPDLVLGVPLKPGSDTTHFCKPADVAVLQNGEFYVADGYCNARIMHFDKTGQLLKQWGEPSQAVMIDSYPPPSTFDLVHSVTLLESRSEVCVADRGNGRLQCFSLEGEFLRQMHPPQIKGGYFAVQYNPSKDVLYLINGPDAYNRDIQCQGFTLNPETGAILQTWSPSKGFSQPHDLAVDPHGGSIYVGELSSKVWKFTISQEAIQGYPSVHKKGSAAHPPAASVDAGVDLSVDDEIERATEEEASFGASLVIGALLIVPVVLVVAITLFLRLRKRGTFANLLNGKGCKQNRRFNLGNLLLTSDHKGFNRVRTTDDCHHDELEHLNSDDSEVEEFSAATVEQKA
ncbi:hypothetical protein CAPTEDRAFT_228792 [Capitella teleta]|uniref:Peptidylglycine monooxygenase n=1 Tax=Capitella teleta TaxID=283909 RepID=R7TRW1_CAPTE|nr:hypothetical protein CAPTEDRAFT_228792 [Capitella teleta]|eukprot:ELT96668.1 hypothetical protein CAPTEDRAFT_228792 [Capitella teleta]